MPLISPLMPLPQISTNAVSNFNYSCFQSVLQTGRRISNELLILLLLLLLLLIFLFNWLIFGEHSKSSQIAKMTPKKEPLWLASVKFLQARCPSCNPINSIKVLNG